MIFIYSIRESGKRKIGITNSPKNRLRSIRATYPRSKWAVLLPTPFVAGIIEKMFHKLFAWFRVTRKGSGKTEWFTFWPFGWVVDLVLIAVVAVSWVGVWFIFDWFVKTY
jgi:hypothetical protein